MLVGCLLANNAKPIYMRWSIEAAYEKQPSADYFNLFASSKNARKRQRFSEPVVLSEENAVRVMTIHASKG